MVEILGGSLSGLGCANGSRTMMSNGVFLNVYSISHFVDPEDYFTELELLISHVRSSRTAPGFEEILISGEPEFRCASHREKEGIEVDDTTWATIREEARAISLDPNPWQSLFI